MWIASKEVIPFIPRFDFHFYTHFYTFINTWKEKKRIIYNNNNNNVFVSKGVNFEYDTTGELVVKDNYFMSYHTSLKTSKDFYMALENSKNIARHLSEILTGKLNRTIQVFPYR